MDTLLWLMLLKSLIKLLPRTTAGPTSSGYKESVNLELVRTFLDAGADPNEKGKVGPPLHLASFLGSLACVKLLLKKGADINSAGDIFESALLAALLGDHRNVIAFLLEQEIDINICSSRFGTALHFATLHRGQSLVQTLLQHGANVNSTWRDDETPLKVLLDAGHGASMTVEHGIDNLIQYGGSLRVTSEGLKQAIVARPHQLQGDSFKKLLNYADDTELTDNFVAAFLADNHFESEDILQTLSNRASGFQATPTRFLELEDTRSYG